MFLPVLIVCCLFVCLSVSKITQKRVPGFSISISISFSIVQTLTVRPTAHYIWMKCCVSTDVETCRRTD